MRKLPAAARTAVVGGLAAIAKRGLPAVARVGAGAVAYAAVAGTIAYLVTKELQDGAARGETPQNLTSLAFARAHRRLQADLGRAPTSDELHDLYHRIAIEISRALTAGSVPGGELLRTIMNLFRSK
jgi:hypothetical protein